MKSVLSFLLVLITCTTNAQVNYSGIYGDNSHAEFSGKDFEEYRKNGFNPEADARWGIQSLILIKKNNDEYKFWLYADRGYPSYNSGQIEGVIHFIGSKAVFNQYDSILETRCKIIFEIKGNTVSVDDNLGEGCGYGANVTASGDYKRKNKKSPTINDIKSIYQYEIQNIIITSSKAFIHNAPNASTVSKQYFIKGDVIPKFAEDENDLFIFTQFITNTGKYVEGWIKKSDIKQ